MRAKLKDLGRYIATPRVSKYRLFVWIDEVILPDCQLFAFASADDYVFGVLHSRVHEVWARAQGTQVRERESGFRYTPTTCFETFPFPEPTDRQREVIAKAARELDRLRNNWLNPPEWTREEVLEFPGSVDGPWKRYLHDPDTHGIGTVRYPRLVPKDEECAQQLKKRTLTNLYNQQPTWLKNATCRGVAGIGRLDRWAVVRWLTRFALYCMMTVPIVLLRAVVAQFNGPRRVVRFGPALEDRRPLIRGPAGAVPRCEVRRDAWHEDFSDLGPAAGRGVLCAAEPQS